MFPAQQRLKPGDPLGRSVDHWLVVNLEPAGRNRIAQVLIKLPAFLGVAVQIFGVEMVPPASTILGGVKRQIGVADQGLGGDPVFRRKSDSDRSSDYQAVTIDRIGFG